MKKKSIIRHEKLFNKTRNTGWVIIHSGILVDYKSKMAKIKQWNLFERAYSKVLHLYFLARFHKNAPTDKTSK